MLLWVKSQGDAGALGDNADPGDPHVPADHLPPEGHVVLSLCPACLAGIQSLRIGLEGIRSFIHSFITHDPASGWGWACRSWRASSWSSRQLRPRAPQWSLHTHTTHTARACHIHTLQGSCRLPAPPGACVRRSPALHHRSWCPQYTAHLAHTGCSVCPQGAEQLGTLLVRVGAGQHGCRSYARLGHTALRAALPHPTVSLRAGPALLGMMSWPT